jgi:hypothetical protein
MPIELKKETLANAISRCRRVRPLVACVSLDEKSYLVESSDRMTMYPVKLSAVGKRRFAECACFAGRGGVACFHVVAAATLHIGLMRQRQQGGRRAGH